MRSFHPTISKPLRRGRARWRLASSSAVKRQEPFPTTGYLLLVPEEEVTDIDWTFEETIQAMVSFGITAPGQIQYYAGSGGEPFAIEDVKTKG